MAESADISPFPVKILFVLDGRVRSNVRTVLTGVLMHFEVLDDLGPCPTHTLGFWPPMDSYKRSRETWMRSPIS